MTKFKNYLFPFLAGLAVSILLVIIMLKVTVNFQIILIGGAGLFSIAGYLTGRMKSTILINALLLNVSFSALFIVLVLPQIPALFYFLLLFFIATVLGIFLRRRNTYIWILTTLFFFAFLCFTSLKIVPGNISGDLTTLINESIEDFEIVDMEGVIIKSKDLKGKVVILDFFGTWCKPCIAELKELHKVKAEFSEEELAVFVINPGLGGDTPEKMRNWINKNNYSFHFAFDEKAQLYETLELNGQGLPVLLILDKDGKLRFRHWGYNKGETNFKNELVEFIETLME